MLPKYLKPLHVEKSNLIRIGPKTDGGYVVDKRILGKNKILVTCGLNDDWEFEKDFIKKNGDVSIIAFDHTVNNEFCHECGMKKSLLFNKYFKESYFKSLFVIRFSKKLYKSLKRINSNLLLLTNHHKEVLIKENFSESRLFILPNYISNISNANINTKKQFLYAGRVSKEKGVEELIKSFLSLDLKDFCLKIIGTGPDLIRLKTKYLSENVNFSGFVDNKEVLNEIQNSTVIVSATKLYEGQPTLLCEASLNSVPVIFPKTGGIK